MASVPATLPFDCDPGKELHWAWLAVGITLALSFVAMGLHADGRVWSDWPVRDRVRILLKDVVVCYLDVVSSWYFFFWCVFTDMNAGLSALAFFAAFFGSCHVFTEWALMGAGNEEDLLPEWGLLASFGMFDEALSGIAVALALLDSECGDQIPRWLRDCDLAFTILGFFCNLGHAVTIYCVTRSGKAGK